MPVETLKRQLENARFEHALEVTESLASHRALLTTMELERINNILTGAKPTPAGPPNPWRQEPITLTLPTGRIAEYSLVSDPKLAAREKLHRATEFSEKGHVIDGAVDIYVGLVLAHVFKDANRRTAVLAAHYFLRRYGLSVSGLALHDIGLGDIRDPLQVEKLKQSITEMAKFVSKRKD